MKIIIPTVAVLGVMAVAEEGDQPNKTQMPKKPNLMRVCRKAGIKDFRRDEALKPVMKCFKTSQLKKFDQCMVEQDLASLEISETTQTLVERCERLWVAALTEFQTEKKVYQCLDKVATKDDSGAMGEAINSCVDFTDFVIGSKPMDTDCLKENELSRRQLNAVKKCFKPLKGEKPGKDEEDQEPPSVDDCAFKVVRRDGILKSLFQICYDTSENSATCLIEEYPQYLSEDQKNALKKCVEPGEGDQPGKEDKPGKGEGNDQEKPERPSNDNNRPEGPGNNEQE